MNKPFVKSTKKNWHRSDPPPPFFCQCQDVESACLPVPRLPLPYESYYIVLRGSQIPSAGKFAIESLCSCECYMSDQQVELKDEQSAACYVGGGVEANDKDNFEK